MTDILNSYAQGYFAAASGLAAQSWTEGFADACCRDWGGLGHAAFGPWAKLEEPAVFAWFHAALSLPADFAPLNLATQELWGAAGLFPGVARLQAGAPDPWDMSEPLTAPDDWVGPGLLREGQPVSGAAFVTVPFMCPASQIGGRDQVLDVGYIDDAGQAYFAFRDRDSFGRDPQTALDAGTPWRAYSTPIKWLSAALRFADNYDAANTAKPGGGAILDLDRFIESYGEHLIVDFGRDTGAAAHYTRRRKAILRPNRPALPDVIARQFAAKPGAGLAAAARAQARTRARDSRRVAA